MVEAWAKWQEANEAASAASATVTKVLRSAYPDDISQRRAAKLLGISVSAVRERLGLRHQPKNAQA